MIRLCFTFIVLLGVLCVDLHAAGDAPLEHGRSILAQAGKQAELKVVAALQHQEVFRIRNGAGKTILEGGSGAGLLYCVQAMSEGDHEAERLEKPLPLVVALSGPAKGKCSVWTRMLRGGEHHGRALALEIGGERVPPTHADAGPDKGVWKRALWGRVFLLASLVEMRIHPVGKHHPAIDAVMVGPDANWRL